MLETYYEVIFISTGVGASVSYNRALEAVSYMGREGEKVRVFDSGHLSTGLGHLVIRAVEMVEDGASADEILSALSELKNRVSTSFITVNADYLYRNGHIPQGIKKLCDLFGIHPILMMKNGRISLKSVMLGDYEKAGLRYVYRELRRAGKIDKTRIFITHAGCSTKKIEKIKAVVNKICRPENLIVTKASATISSNCGPDTFGILYINERNARR